MQNFQWILVQILYVDRLVLKDKIESFYVREAMMIFLNLLNSMVYRGINSMSPHHCIVFEVYLKSPWASVRLYH